MAQSLVRVALLAAACTGSMVEALKLAHRTVPGVPARAVAPLSRLAFLPADRTQRSALLRQRPAGLMLPAAIPHRRNGPEGNNVMVPRVVAAGYPAACGSEHSVEQASVLVPAVTAQAPAATENGPLFQFSAQQRDLVFQEVMQNADWYDIQARTMGQAQQQARAKVDEILSSAENLVEFWSCCPQNAGPYNFVHAHPEMKQLYEARADPRLYDDGLHVENGGNSFRKAGAVRMTLAHVFDYGA